MKCANNFSGWVRTAWKSHRTLSPGLKLFGAFWQSYAQVRNHSRAGPSTSWAMRPIWSKPRIFAHVVRGRVRKAIIDGWAIRFTATNQVLTWSVYSLQSAGAAGCSLCGSHLPPTHSLNIVLIRSSNSHTNREKNIHLFIFSILVCVKYFFFVLGFGYVVSAQAVLCRILKQVRFLP